MAHRRNSECIMGDFENHHWQPITDPGAPRVRCDEALPLGNALMGALIWMQGDTLRLSLDRGDLWDERRPASNTDPDYNWRGMCGMIERGEWKRLAATFQKSAAEPFPTRLPGGRLELPWQAAGCRFALDEKRAKATITGAAGTLEVIVPAVEEAVTRWKMTGAMPECRLRMPAFEDGTDPAVPRLGYAPPVRRTSAAGTFIAIENPDRTLGYAIGIGTRPGKSAGTVEGAAVIAKAESVDAALAAAERDLAAALQRDYAAVQQEHEAWWNAFYARSDADFGDAVLTAAWHTARYFFGSNARAGRPAMPLQGIWTMDNGTLPPWRGDYHNNLNTQFNYLAYLAANDLDGGREFLDFLFERLPIHQKLAREFYGIDRGAVIPGAMTRAGNYMPASVNYTYHPDNGMWVAWMFYRHWRYTQDRAFLEKEAYPYAKAVAEGAIALTTLDGEGKYRFAWHASPELGDDKPEAYFKEMTSYAGDNLYALLDALVKMAQELGLADDAAAWRSALAHCCRPEEFTADYDYYLYSKTVLGIQRGVSLPNSHRHLVHLMGLYPFDLFDFEHDPEIRFLLDETMNQLDFFGPGQWVGFSFTWAAIMALRLGNPGKALDLMHRFYRGFCSINGFQLNGDYKDLGYSAYKYRPFTMETNFSAQEALQELLLTETQGLLKFFPAAAELPEARFTDFRAPGAFLVSGECQSGRIRTIRIVSEAGKPCRFANPNGQRWSIAEVSGKVLLQSTDPEIEFATVPGGRYLLTPEAK